MKTLKLFYIVERSNPQFSKPYYISYGQLSQLEAKKKADSSIYGTNSLLSYITKKDYEDAKVKLTESGYRVSNNEK